MNDESVLNAAVNSALAWEDSALTWKAHCLTARSERDAAMQQVTDAGKLISELQHSVRLWKWRALHASIFGLAALSVLLWRCR